MRAAGLRARFFHPRGADLEFRSSAAFVVLSLCPFPEAQPASERADGLRGSAPWRFGLRAGLIPLRGGRVTAARVAGTRRTRAVPSIGSPPSALVPSTATHRTGGPCMEPFCRLTWPSCASAAWEADSPSAAARFLLLLLHSRWLLSLPHADPPLRVWLRTESPNPELPRAGDAEESRVGWGPGQPEPVGGSRPTAGPWSCGVFEVLSRPKHAVLRWFFVGWGL